VIFWELNMRRILFDFYAHTDVILSLQLLCNGMVLLTQGKEGTIKAWSLPKMVMKLYKEVIIEPSVVKYFQGLEVEYNIQALIDENKKDEKGGDKFEVRSNPTKLNPNQEFTFGQEKVDKNKVFQFDDDDDAADDGFDIGDYGYMLADTHTISIEPEIPIGVVNHPEKFQPNNELSQIVNDKIANLDHEVEQNEEKLSQSRLFELEAKKRKENIIIQCLYRVTLLDIFLQCTNHLIFSFDSAVEFRMSVLITNCYTFSKMKTLFIEEQLLSKETLLSANIADTVDNTIHLSDGEFIPQSAPNLNDENDDIKVREFLAKNAKKRAQNGSNNVNSDRKKIIGFDKNPNAQNSEFLTATPTTTTTNINTPEILPFSLDSNHSNPQSNTTPTTTTPHLDIFSSVLDIGYLLLSPCENSSSLKIWRLTFSFNLHSFYSTFDLTNISLTPNSLPQLNHSLPSGPSQLLNTHDNTTAPVNNTINHALGLFFAYCDAIDINPFHIQTLVIDKEDNEDEVNQDTSLAELRRINQFKSQPTLDEIDSFEKGNDKDDEKNQMFGLTLEEKITQDEINFVFSGMESIANFDQKVTLQMNLTILARLNY